MATGSPENPNVRTAATSPGASALHDHEPGHVEVEIKLRPAALEAVVGMAAGLGFRVVQARAFERNTLVDTPEAALLKKGELLRLREFAGEAVLTFKGPSLADGKHKRREELETHVSSATATAALLERIGFLGTFRYEKYRTVYARPNDEGLLTVDETPIGPFLELEGSPEWIDRVAAELGFSVPDYITDSYGQIWLRHCADKGLPVTDFVFGSDNDTETPAGS
jgi:adenylate cyclase, class 2